MTRWSSVLALLLLGCGGSVDGDGGGQGGSGGSSSCVSEHWRWIPPRADALHRGDHYAASWGPSEVLVWGGLAGPDWTSETSTGWRVRPDGSLVALPTQGAPPPRGGAVFEVLGDRLVVWGGASRGGVWRPDGARLDLATDDWLLLTTVGQPEPRLFPVTGVVNDRVLVWGGIGEELPTNSGFYGNGFLYDSENLWKQVPGSPLELAASQAAVAQAGADVAVLEEPGSLEEPGPAKLRVFDAKTESWRAASTVGAPSARTGAVVVYLPGPRELLVWGGYGYGTGDLGDGARYSLASDSWKPTTAEGAPDARTGAYAAVLGTPELGERVVIWGGTTGLSPPSRSGGIYDVASDRWEPLPEEPCTPPSLNSSTFTAFGDGRRALLWGGSGPDQPGELPEQGWVFTLSP